jgi:threonine-phosphate decarboxylase
MKHGGDILTYQNLYKGRIVDFSSNINPLGPPEGLREAIIERFNTLIAYPDIKYRRLRESIAEYLGCRADEVIVGNGAVEIINNFSMMFNRVVVFIPCFAEYIERPKILGKEILKLKLDNEFKINLNMLTQNLRAGDLLILGNPNNPTGLRIDIETLQKIQGMVNDKGAFLLLDEAFFEFCYSDYDSIRLFYNSLNVCVIRAATKFFGIPGIRLGYAWTNSSMVQKYCYLSLPWSVNSFAEIAGRYIFKDREYINKTKEYIQLQREYMAEELKRIENIKVFDTHANFILIKLLTYDEDYIFDSLIKRGMLIRKASSFEGLDKSYIRVAIKDYDSNKMLIEGLKECLEWRA